MKCEILEYRYQLDWNLDFLLNDQQFKELCDPSWPLVLTTYTGFRQTDEEICWSDFLAGKKRTKPTYLKNCKFDSTMSYIADKLNLSSQVFDVIATCSSSLYAFYTASLISQDMQTPVIVFAGDNRTDNFSLWHFNSFGALDQTTGRPFDTSSKGFKMGAGAALYIVKHPSVKSKLTPKAVIQDFYFYTQPNLIANPGTAEDLIKKFSVIDYKTIDLWNAHATGTPVGDSVEYEFFSKTCKHNIPIVSFKGHVGHCMAASGAIEIALTLDCKQSNVLTPNYIVGDKIVDDDRIITEPTSFSYKRMLKTSLGFGGKTAIAIIDLL